MEQTLNTLLKKYKQYRLSVLGLIALLSLSVVLAVVSTPLATLCVLGIAVVYHFGLLRRLQKEYTRLAARENVLNTLGAALGTDSLAEDSGGALTEEDVSAAQLLPYNEEKGGCLLRQGISGQWQGMETALCDATLMQDFQLVSGGKRRVHFTSGVWVRVTLPQSTGMDWRLVDRDAMPSPVRLKYYETLFHLEEKDCSLPNMQLYSLAEGGSVPSGGVLKQVKALAEYTPGKVAVSLRGNLLSVFIAGRFVAMPISVKTPPTAHMITLDPLPELDYIGRLAKAICRQD